VISKYRLLALEFITVLALFALLHLQWPHLNVSFAQLAVFPLMALFFAQLRLYGVRIPRGLLFAAAAGALIAFCVPYLYPARRRVVLASTLADDDYESESRIFWQELDRWLRLQDGVGSARFYGSFSKHKRAAAVFKTYPGAIGIVWGNTRWINLSLPAMRSISLYEAGLGSSPEGPFALELVTAVQVVGTSYAPRGDSARVIAALMTGLQYAADGRDEAAKGLLRYAGERAAFWITNAHRGLAWLLLGNLYLREGFADGRYQPAALSCAETAYIAAISNLMPWDNPELSAAINNNLGVLYYLQGRFQHKPALLKRARASWRYAASLRELKNPFHLRYRAPKVAQRNAKRARALGAADRQSGKGRAAAKARKKKGGKDAARQRHR